MNQQHKEKSKNNDSTYIIQTKTRETDPNVSQRIAANPQDCIWVGASAGTGKTKVLTDRVLRLLLPREDGTPGTPPHKIMCLTFTKAGASEMALRINKTLARWAIAPLGTKNSHQTTLEESLKKLLGRAPTKQEIEHARRLFARVIDSKGGLKIMTIHSFCQSVLGRFPLEAKIAPYATVMEESEANELLKQAYKQALKAISEKIGAPDYEALMRLAETINEDQFLSLIKAMNGERHQFENIVSAYFGIDGIYTKLCETFGILAGTTAHDIIQKACRELNFNKTELQTAAHTLSKSKGKQDNERAHAVRIWLRYDEEKRLIHFEKYRNAFLTSTQDIRKQLASKAAQKENPNILDVLQNEASRLYALSEKIKNVECVQFTYDLIKIGYNVIQIYQSLKEKQAKLDYNDLIFKTLSLIKEQSSASWVLYKLDEGLDHLLIDEAQDTNPEQWQIIEALCAEFFTNMSGDGITRTIFTVGDEKQSIYSFQRASPEEFQRMHDDFAQKIKSALQNWKSLKLNISFRSTRSVLEAVDRVFADPAMRKDIDDAPIEHIPFRKQDAGIAEIWPLFEADEKHDFDPWEPPTKIVETRSGATKLATHIADQISNWIYGNHILESKARPIRPGDIMILVRSRTAFIHQLSRALKSKNIPVSGLDRMILSNELVIQDILSAASFALLPSDDLTLACLLKSPLIGLSEDDLYDLAIDRPSSLWESLQNRKTYRTVWLYLESLIQKSSTVSPFEFFSALIQSPCPADSISGLRALKNRLGSDIADPIEEFLQAALSFEKKNLCVLQIFLNWFENERIEIKREMEEGSNQVRIMTVHGSKGLQAPIVILPDTIQTAVSMPKQIDKRLLWPDKTDLPVPICSARKNQDPEIFTQTLSIYEERAQEEYKRLLYVAMTRAEDRLYVGGYQEYKPPLESSWYFAIRKALETAPDIETLDNGTLRLSNPQTREIQTSAEKKSERQNLELPSWVHKNAHPESTPPVPLSPSKPFDYEQAASSPLEKQSQNRFRRGNLTHKLLEILPELPHKKRKRAAHHYLEKYASDLEQTIRDDIAIETFNILENPDFSNLFGLNSSAELQISGITKSGHVVNGRVDRLYIDDNDIWIIDYKTNRPPPKNPNQIPAVYQKQMQVYTEILKQIYPEKTIHAALLWTDGPFIMRIPVDN